MNIVGLATVLEVLYQTRERVFHHDIQTPRREFNRLRGVWISDETLFLVFDIASQTINNYWRNSKQKLAIFYAN
jgi:hypothetical protein